MDGDFILRIYDPEDKRLVEESGHGSLGDLAARLRELRTAAEGTDVQYGATLRRDTSDGVERELTEAEHNSLNDTLAALDPEATFD